MKLYRISLIIFFLLQIPSIGVAQHINSDSAPENFKKENLVAWCIVPYDKMNRTPEERALMLNELGITKVAYDWREKHVTEFEEEILQYKKHDIEFFAFWNEHPVAFKLFEKYDIQPQIWKIVGNPKAATQEEKVQYAANNLVELANKTKKLGCKLGLYNHGGWGGEPENLVEVCKELNKRGFEHVGIVYNFHHAHDQIETFTKDFEIMKPYLLCLNLNGMANPSDVNEKTKENKIVPIGSGVNEKEMIQIVFESGYDGPIGIIGHIETQDVAISIQNNITGLEKILVKK